MGAPLTETVNYDAAVIGVSDSDLVNATVTNSGLQNVTNRTAYLRQVVDIDGVRRIREVANTTALQAISTQQDGDYCCVIGQGIYRFTAGAGGLPSAPLSYVAGSGAAGKWYLQGGGMGIAGVVNGFATLDSSGRVPAQQLPGVVWTTLQQGITSANSISTAPTTVSGLALPLIGIDGDLAFISGQLVANVAGTTPTIIELQLTDGTVISRVYVEPSTATGAFGSPTKSISFPLKRYHISGSSFSSTIHAVVTATEGLIIPNDPISCFLSHFVVRP